MLAIDGGFGTNDDVEDVFSVSRGVRIRRDLIDFYERLLITELVSSTAAFTIGLTFSISLFALTGAGLDIWISLFVLTGAGLNIWISSWIFGGCLLRFGFGSIGESFCVMNML